MFGHSVYTNCCIVCNKKWNNDNDIHCKKCHLSLKKNNDHCCDCGHKWNSLFTHCKQCHITCNSGKKHCCKCKNEWFDEKQIHCNKCFKDGLVAFSFDGINITYVIGKYNGEGIIYNLRGEFIFSGNFKSGRFDRDGLLYFPDGKLQYKGYFSNGLSCGYGILFDKYGNMTSGLFYNSKIITEYGKFKKNDVQEKDSCNLCFDDFDKDELFPICGYNKCTKCCLTCIKSVIQKINCRKGSILTQNCILCPFCRNGIFDDVIKIYNPPLGQYLPNIKKLKSAKEIAGICCECNKCETRVLNVECGEQNNKEKYTCDECLSVNSMKKENIKNCPNCGLKVNKTDGCHFMKCICKKAWCWHCLQIMNYDEVHTWNCKYCGKGT